MHGSGMDQLLAWISCLTYNVPTICFNTVSPDSMCSDPNNCDQVCVSLSDVEQCSCMPGYELHANGQTCEST